MVRTRQEVESSTPQAGQEDEQSRRMQLRQILAELRKKVRDYGITAEQLFGPDLSVFVRFRDPETGKTWNGAGRPPNWIRGKDRERFRVK